MGNENLAPVKSKLTAVTLLNHQHMLSKEKETSVEVAALQLLAMPGMVLQIMRQLENYIRQVH